MIIHLINAVTVAVAAALVAVVLDNTATTRNTIEFILALILSIALIVCVTLSKLWPVNLKDIYLIHFGHPGSILNLAQKCMLAKVSTTIVAIVVACYVDDEIVAFVVVSSAIMILQLSKRIGTPRKDFSSSIFPDLCLNFPS